MKVINVKPLEDCFDGSFIKEARFDAPVTVDFIHHLGKSGNLEYHPDFPRPFYKVDLSDGTIVKGVEGNQTARIILHRSEISASLQRFEHLVLAFSN